MKTIFKRITLAVACLAGLCSCNDFLTTKPYDFLAHETFYATKSNCEMALSGVYSTLSREEFYGANYIVDLLLGNDLSYYQRKLSTTNGTPASNSHTVSNATLYNLWAVLYAGINNANLLIENIDGSDLEDDEKVRMKGEARFLRAYYHWILVQGWHEVPLRKSSFTDMNETYALGATSHAEALKWIIDEMEDCVDMVDDSTYDKSPSYVKKNTVMGILARVYLWRAGNPLNGGVADYEKAAYWANEVKKSAKHSLNPDYEAIWKNMCSDKYDPVYNETIWEAEFYGTRTDGNETMGRIGNKIGNFNKSQQYGYGFSGATLLLYDLYPEKDIRRDISICPYTVGEDGVTKTEKKYIGQRQCGKFRREWEDTHGYTPNKNYTGCNWPILRYSDVLLMLAEAENEVNGPTDAAYEAINEVRNRAGIEPLSGLDQAAFRQEIRDERGRELCFEALRKFDLVRWGIYVKALKEDLALARKDTKRWGGGDDNTQTPDALTVNTESKHQFWPIPEKELAVNGELSQNSYWK